MPETKQDILNEITDLLELPHWTLPRGGGSSLPSHVFEAAASRVGTRTGSMPVMAESIARKAGYVWTPDHDSRHTRSGGGSTVTREGLRVFADALETLLSAATSPQTYLLTWNPTMWHWPGDQVAAWIDATAAGQIVHDRWSTGSRVQGIKTGDRAFLLRQSVEPRGVIASGTFTSGVFQDEHWDGTGRQANYAEVDYDLMIDPHDPLPLSDLKKAAPEQEWGPMGSGTLVKTKAARILQTLWSQHAAAVTTPQGQARQRDVERRLKTENAAQERLMSHYRDRGWMVEDTRIGNPFDARAKRGGETLYLEAKGTTTNGASVIVTRNEVKFAQEHPGECVIGIWSRIRFDSNGDVDPHSGRFEVHDWQPADADLEPRDYDWTSPGAGSTFEST